MKIGQAQPQICSKLRMLYGGGGSIVTRISSLFWVGRRFISVLVQDAYTLLLHKIDRVRAGQQLKLIKYVEMPHQI